jgi:hypothetical protein
MKLALQVAPQQKDYVVTQRAVVELEKLVRESSLRASRLRDPFASDSDDD